MTIRAAIWTAVSTEGQIGPDKLSLTDQETRSRSLIANKGWQESSGPYIVPGESRTRFVNLRDAEEAIPDLRRMLNDASHNRFDVLVMYDHNRLRDLLKPVARVLFSYHKQIYSLAQPLEPTDPEHFDQSRARHALMLLGFSEIISDAQINDLQAKYRDKMPLRVTERGLPAISIPFGYRKPPGHETDRSAIPVQDPGLIPLLITMKDMFLSGKSMRDIATMATLSGIHPPRSHRWYPQTVRDILRNPFYAGFNRWGLSHNFTDLRTGRRRRNRDVPPDDIVVSIGKHAPLWNEETHRQLVLELDRRGNSYRGKSFSAFSRLLRCGECSSTMWMHHNGPIAEPDRSIWRCSKDSTHPGIPQSVIIKNLGETMGQELRKQKDALPADASPDENKIRAHQAELADLQTKRRRLEDAYLSGGFELPDYMRRASELDARITASEDSAAQALRQAHDRHDRLALIGGLLGAVDRFDEWLETVDPGEANQILRSLLDHIQLGKDGEIVELAFR